MNHAQQTVLAVVGVLVGFAVGSFICVIIERLPVQLGEPDEFGDLYATRPWSEVLGGASRCSSCGAPIRAYHKIPVISWLALRGRCSSCGDRIPAFHPAVELAVPAIGAAMVAAIGWEWRLLPILWLVPVGVAVSAIDFRTMIVPTKLVWPAFAVSLVLSVVASGIEGEWSWLWGGVVGILALAGPLFVIWFLLPAAMGFGDVRLATLLGWTVGFSATDGSWRTAMFAAVSALALSAIIGVVLSLIGLTARGRNAKVPFGPSLVAGSLVIIAFSDQLLRGFSIT